MFEMFEVAQLAAMFEAMGFLIYDEEDVELALPDEIVPV